MSANTLVAMAWSVVRAELLRAAGKTVNNLDGPDVAAAKVEACAWIQSHHHLPGELRRFLCNEVNGISATDINDFKTQLKSKIDVLLA